MSLRQAHFACDALQLDLTEPPLFRIRVGRCDFSGPTNDRVELLSREATTGLVTHAAEILGLLT